MREGGVEPPRRLRHRILNPVCAVVPAAVGTRSNAFSLLCVVTPVVTRLHSDGGDQPFSRIATASSVQSQGLTRALLCHYCTAIVPLFVLSRNGLRLGVLLGFLGVFLPCTGCTGSVCNCSAPRVFPVSKSDCLRSAIILVLCVLPSDRPHPLRRFAHDHSGFCPRLRRP